MCTCPGVCTRRRGHVHKVIPTWWPWKPTSLSLSFERSTVNPQRGYTTLLEVKQQTKLAKVYNMKRSRPIIQTSSVKNLPRLSGCLILIAIYVREAPQQSQWSAVTTCLYMPSLVSRNSSYEILNMVLVNQERTKSPTWNSEKRRSYLAKKLEPCSSL